MRGGWRRGLRLSLLALLVALGAGLGVLAWLALGSLPKLSGEMRLAGLSGPVEVVRDRWAIPHVRAQSEADAYRAMGFLHAQDRLWQMEVNRHIGQGRLAEIVGRPGLQFDRFLRTLGLARAATASLAGVSIETRGLLDAYAAGVNGFLAARSGPLPPEFLILRHAPEPWRPEDSLLQLKLMALDLSGNWREELLRARLALSLTPEQVADLWPDSPPTDPVTLRDLKAALGDAGLPVLAALPEVPSGLGSNSWVVAGDRTASGKPILANDPHLGLTMPGIWYLAHLEAPGLSVIGATIPGMPVVVLGRNRDVAWGFTNTGSDVQDLFVEASDPADPGRYLTPDGSAPFATREEVILVKGEAEQRLRVRETRHGPIMSEAMGVPAERLLALAWTGLAPGDRTVEAGFALAHTRDWGSFNEALRSFTSVTQNVFYADRDGGIGLVNPGLVPIRKAGDGRLPVPGADGRHDWTGFIPFDALPRQLRRDGTLLNANNRLVGPDYPHLLTLDWEPPFRAKRIEAGLAAAGERTDLAAMQALQLDQRSGYAEALLPVLLATSPPDAPAREMLDALRGWDLVMAPDRWQPLLFAAWYRQLGPLIWADELRDTARGVRADALIAMLTTRQAWCDDVATAAPESCADRSREALARALAGLRQTHGEDWRGWRWGDAHRAVLGHRPLEAVPYLGRAFSTELPMGGDGSTLNVASFPPAPPEASFRTTHAASYRALYDLADPDASRFVAATGQSGHSFSSHYRDLSRLWAEGRNVPMSMDPGQYREGAVGTLTLRP